MSSRPIQRRYGRSSFDTGKRQTEAKRNFDVSNIRQTFLHPSLGLTSPHLTGSCPYEGTISFRQLALSLEQGVIVNSQLNHSTQLHHVAIPRERNIDLIELIQTLIHSQNALTQRNAKF